MAGRDYVSREMGFSVATPPGMEKVTGGLTHQVILAILDLGPNPNRPTTRMALSDSLKFTTRKQKISHYKL